MDYFRHKISQFNIFDTKSNDVTTVRIEKCSSWLYLTQTTTVRVTKPSLSNYNYLQSTYSNTLRCLCSKTQVALLTFLEIYPSFHQICSSPFVTQSWIDSNFPNNLKDLSLDDIRLVMSAYAQTLRFLCQVSQVYMDSVSRLYLDGFIYTPMVISDSSLTSAIQTIIDSISTAAPDIASVNIILFSFFIGSQLFINAFGTNAIFYLSPERNRQFSISIAAHRMQDGSLCYCFPTASCTTPAAIYLDNQISTDNLLSVNTNRTLIPGMKTDCYPFDGLKASTLECFFDSSCLQILTGDLLYFRPLNGSLPSRYSPADTVNTLLQTLFIENVSFTYSFEIYYNQCAPQVCVYSYVHRNTPLTIISTLVGITSGLHAALAFAIPNCLVMIIKFKNKLLGKTKRKPPESGESSSQNVTTSEKLKNLWIAIKGLNLFSSNTTDRIQIQREVQMTHTFILVLCVTCTSIAFYIGLSKTNVTHIINNPSQHDYEFLEKIHGNNLQCPCQRSQIRYVEIIQLRINYHQICSSGFISPFFIGQFFRFDHTNTYKHDVLTMTGTYFTHIAFFCFAVQNQLKKSYDGLLGSEFYVKTVVNAKDFETHVGILMASVEEASNNDLHQIISEFTELLSNVHAMSTSYASFELRMASNGDIHIDPSKISNCSCVTSSKTCSTPAAFYQYDSTNGTFEQLYNVTGMRIGCLPFQSTIQSSFACWYSAECYEKVIEFWQNRITNFGIIPPLLNRTLDVSFDPADPIIKILEKGMINTKVVEWNYESFFSKCAAHYCFYSLNQRQNIVFIITSLIGIFSGLSVVLRLLTPFMIHTVHWCLGLYRGQFQLLQQLRQLPTDIVQLNLFFHHLLSSPATSSRERWTTRFYLFIWCIVFISLVMYNSFAEQTITITVTDPDRATYKQLFASNNNSLQCPCDVIAFRYDSFVEVDARLHQVCSSSFIETEWINSVFGDGNWSNIPMNEFRNRGVVYFLIQQSICGMAQRFRDLFVREVQRKIISKGILLTEEQLLIQVNITVEGAKNWALNNFLIVSEAGRSSAHFNQLMNIFSSNWAFAPIPSTVTNLSNYQLKTRPVSHGPNCSCATSYACTEPVFVDGELVPGFLLGCSPLESLLRSSLSCLYNATCIERINFGNLSSIRPLDLTIPSRYRIDSSVDELMVYGLVEEWTLNVSYPLFFKQCQASSCSYSISTRKATFQIVALILSLYGGVTMILRLFASLAIRWVEILLSIATRRRDPITPFT